MRNLYLVCYDIADPKRLGQVFRKLRGFGEAVQYSVFLCALSKQERALMLGELRELINHAEDRVMAADLGPLSGRAQRSLESLGRKTSVPSGSGAVIV